MALYAEDDHFLQLSYLFSFIYMKIYLYSYISSCISFYAKWLTIIQFGSIQIIFFLMTACIDID